MGSGKQREQACFFVPWQITFFLCKAADCPLIALLAQSKWRSCAFSYRPESHISVETNGEQSRMHIFPAPGLFTFGKAPKMARQTAPSGLISIDLSVTAAVCS